MKLRARLKTADGQTTTLIADASNLHAGDWTHVAMIYDGQTLKLYQDGVEVGSVAMSGALLILVLEGFVKIGKHMFLECKNRL